MSKITEFYAKAAADEGARVKLQDILGGKDIHSASDDELVKIGELAKEMGYDISIDEAKAFLDPIDSELDDDDLDAVAGGKGESDTKIHPILIKAIPQEPLISPAVLKETPIKSD